MVLLGCTLCACAERACCMAHLQLVLAPGRDNDLGALPCQVLCYGGTQALQVPDSADGSETQVMAC